MKKVLFICLLAALSAQAYSREMPKVDVTVDLKAVEKAVQDTAYYNTLERQFFNFKFMTPEDIVNLFYGQAFQEDYSPMDKYFWKSAIDELIENGKTELAWGACLSLLQKRPAYLPLLNYTIQVAEQAEIDKDIITLLTRNEARLLIILGNSGDGKSMENPFIVTCISDEYLLLYRGFVLNQTKGQEAVIKDGKHYDILEVEPDGIFESGKVYFDTTLSSTHIRKNSED